MPGGTQIVIGWRPLWGAVGLTQTRRAPVGTGAGTTATVYLNSLRSYYLQSEPKGGNAIGVLPVLLHELGHAFGLRHSYSPAAVMAPAYSGAKTALTQNDKTRIRRLYR